MRRLLVLVPLALAGCSFGSDAPDATAPEPRRLTGAQAHAPAPPTAGALTQIADGRDARRRLAYVNVQALADADLPLAAAAVADRVLGRGAAVLASLPPGAARSAVQVGKDATVLRGPEVDALDGLASGEDGIVVGGAGETADLLTNPAPETSAITPGAQSAVQSCLGDTLAQTILGPGTMGEDAALGAGLAESGDPPAGIQVRVCGAPKYIRHIHAMEKALQQRFGSLNGGPVIEEREIGEREIMTAVLPAAQLSSDEILGLLAGGRALRSLAWR